MFTMTHSQFRGYLVSDVNFFFSVQQATVQSNVTHQMIEVCNVDDAEMTASTLGHMHTWATELNCTKLPAWLICWKAD